MRSERTPPPIFGWQPNSESIDEIIQIILSKKRAPQEGVGLVVTPNIQHIAELRKNLAFRDAYTHAAMILCDGFPVYYYARARGHAVCRVPGSDLLKELLSKPESISNHRLFFVIDSERTAQAVTEWAEERHLRSNVLTHIPPFGFNDDPAHMAKLADDISSHSTTLLIMAVGAPRSEIFVNLYRTSLPPCWALCVGQGVQAMFGIVRRAPILVRRMNAEWLWRITQQPGRLLPRYIGTAIAFSRSVSWDLLGKSGPPEGLDARTSRARSGKPGDSPTQ